MYGERHSNVLLGVSNYVEKGMATYVVKHVVSYVAHRVVKDTIVGKGGAGGNQMRVTQAGCLRFVGCCWPRVVAVKKREEWRLKVDLVL